MCRNTTRHESEKDQARRSYQRDLCDSGGIAQTIQSVCVCTISGLNLRAWHNSDSVCVYLICVKASGRKKVARSGTTKTSKEKTNTLQDRESICVCICTMPNATI